MKDKPGTQSKEASEDESALLKNTMEFLQGILLGNTTDLVGFPVQALGDALNAVGVPVGDRPVGGTNWLREILKQPAPADESLAQTLGSLVGVPDPQSLMGLGGIMMGAKSKTWSKDAAEVLNAFEKEGALTPDAARAIFEELNVYRGADKKLRQEISDQPAKLKDTIKDWGSALPLKDVLDHPELFQAYPSLQKLSIALDPKRAADGGASFSRGGLLTNSQISFNPNSETARTDLLHELQHAVQSREGFARGGNPDAFLGSDDLYKARNALIETGPKNAANLSDETLATMLYRRLAGETEARLVESRADIPPDLLRTLFPPEGYSVPEERQLVKYNSGLWGD